MILDGSPRLSLARAPWIGRLAILLAGLPISQAQEFLLDGDLEASKPDGTFPSSGAWQPAYLGEAGSIVVATGDAAGNAFYLYTGGGGDDFWTAPYQDVPATTGEVFEGSALVRGSLETNRWVAGTRARVHLAFLDANTNVLSSVESAALTSPTTNWQRFEIVTEAAPAETAFVRYMCVLEKPRGSTNLSAAVFDDCSLQPGSFTGLEAWPLALGVPAEVSTVALNIRNTGNTTMTWEVTNAPPWLTITPASGTLEPETGQVLLLSVNRSLLSGTDCVRGSFQVSWENGAVPVRIFVELPPVTAVPDQPALVHVDGRRVVVQDRLPDGQLGPAHDYAVKGVVWSPSSRGTPDAFDLRRVEFSKWYVTDIQLLRELNANTVYTFLDFGTNDAALRVLDDLYRSGIKALVTVDENGTGNTNTLIQSVLAYREHPAILGWVIGNEWDINLYHGMFLTNGYYAAATFTEEMARMVKALDTNHIVVSTHGDIYPPDMRTLANDLCPSVDVWGLNVYRGPSLTTLFADWAGITTKPLWISEFGTDAYRTLMLNESTQGAIVSADGAVDEDSQARWNRGLWREIASQLSADNPQGVCLGATVFEWADEWWKGQAAFGAEVGRHDSLGFFSYWNPDSHPDSVANEEWWGLVTVDRQPRLSYRFFQEDFEAVRASIRRTAKGQILISWPARSNAVYTVYYSDGGGAPEAVFAPLLPWTNLAPASNGIFQITDTNGTPSEDRFYRVAAKPR